MLAQPAEALTDLLLGMVVTLLAVRMGRAEGIGRYWLPAFWCTGIAALAGAVHHAVLVRWAGAGRWSWAAISILVVLSVSYLLAATVAEVLGPGHGRVFWMLRSVSLVAYVGVVLDGHAGIAGILACESLTMLSVLVLWGWAAYRRHPLAGPVLLAILASGAAGATQALSPSLTADYVRLDPTSTYHLAQIVGMGLLYRAVTRPAATQPASPPWTGEPSDG